MVLPSLTRRAFMKGLGALAGKAALPKTVTNLLPDVKKAVNMDSAPWIENMVNMARANVASRAPILFGNGTKISYLKAPKINTNHINLVLKQQMEMKI